MFRLSIGKFWLTQGKEKHFWLNLRAFIWTDFTRRKGYRSVMTYVRFFLAIIFYIDHWTIIFRNKSRYPSIKLCIVALVNTFSLWSRQILSCTSISNRTTVNMLFSPPNQNGHVWHYLNQPHAIASKHLKSSCLQLFLIVFPYDVHSTNTQLLECNVSSVPTKISHALSMLLFVWSKKNCTNCTYCTKLCSELVYCSITWV